jgi:hypothetical protein
MLFRTLADAVVLAHTLFVVFVVCGGFLVWRWRWLAWAHVPAALWGVAIEYGGWICPLTPLENALRARAGMVGYRGGFVEHHVLPLLYPPDLTAPTQVVLGSVALIINVIAYGLLARRIRTMSRSTKGYP